jgi:hypothetical protein
MVVGGGLTIFMDNGRGDGGEKNYIHVKESSPSFSEEASRIVGSLSEFRSSTLRKPASGNWIGPKKRFVKQSEGGSSSVSRFEDRIAYLLWPSDVPMPDGVLSEELLLMALIPSVESLVQVLRMEGKRLTLRMLSVDTPTPTVPEWSVKDLIERIEQSGVRLFDSSSIEDGA